MLVRLNSNTTWAQAQAEVQSRGSVAFEGRKIPAGASARLNIAPFERVRQDGLRYRLLILSAVVAIVLLIGCLNIASLLLARGSARRREMGTRIALGGGIGSLMRQLTTESLVLGLVGGAAGLALGYLAIETLQSIVVRYGIWQELRLDGRVLLATTLLSLLVSLVFALAPTFQAARVDVREMLSNGGTRAVAGGQSNWLKRTLVLTEIALSLVLLVGAGLLVRTLLHLQHLDPGFDGTNVLTASASLQDARYRESDSINRLYRESLLAIRDIRGVEAAAVGLHVPYQQWLNSGVKVRSGTASPESEVLTSMNYVTTGYFEVLRIPVRSGRVFDERDTEGSLPVAIINETFARKFLSKEYGLTGHIREGNVTREIVGVVSDLQQQPGLSRSGPIVQEPAMYVPANQFSGFQMTHPENRSPG
ncbi:MAG: FtsX-like permease family protein [Bryobacteraceae bacterium]